MNTQGGHNPSAEASTQQFQSTKLPMLNKYGDFWFAICTFQGESSYQ